MKVNGIWTELDSQCKIQQVNALSGANYDLGGLKPETYYRIEVRAHNAIGSSDPAKIMLKTAIGESNESYGTYVYRAGYTASNANVPKIQSLFFVSCVVFFKFFI